MDNPDTSAASAPAGNAVCTGLVGRNAADKKHAIGEADEAGAEDRRLRRA